MVKTLTRHGNSLALVIDKPILDLLRITADTPLEVTTDGQALVLQPVHDARRQAKFRHAIETANRKFGRALKKLAE